MGKNKLIRVGDTVVIKSTGESMKKILSRAMMKIRLIITIMFHKHFFTVVKLNKDGTYLIRCDLPKKDLEILLARILNGVAANELLNFSNQLINEVKNNEDIEI